MVIWNFDLLWKHYGTMEKNMVLWKKTMKLYQELWNFDLQRKKKLC